MLNALEIEVILWQAIDILRTQYSLGEVRVCILKLLLFKRLSDLLPHDGHQLPIGQESYWSLIEKKHENLAKTINEAFILIEKEYPHLEEVLTDKEVLTDSKFDFWSRFNDKNLHYVIQILSKLDLRGESFSEVRQLGEVIEWLLEKIASLGEKTQRAYTPRHITTMMVELIAPQQGATIYDPACGSGGFLVEALRFVKRNKGEQAKIGLYGQDENIQECKIAKINLMLHGTEQPNVQLGNAIREPAFVEENHLSPFDAVLLNPPFNLKFPKLTPESIVYPSRFPYGIPRNGVGDFLFIQHALSSLKKKGKAAIILPRGVLFREGEEEKIRQDIIEDDWVETVIELAPKLFYHVSIPVSIVIFNRSKRNKKKVLFIDASHEYKPGRGHNILAPEHVERIVSTYCSSQDEEGFARLVSIEEIAKNKYDLSVNRYIMYPNEEVDIASEVEQLHQLEVKRAELEKEIDNYLQALGIEL